MYKIHNYDISKSLQWPKKMSVGANLISKILTQTKTQVQTLRGRTLLAALRKYLPKDAYSSLLQELLYGYAFFHITIASL